VNRILSCLVAVLLAACDSPVGPLLVTARPPSLRLNNRSDSPLYYFIVERESSALVDWIVCALPSCPGVEPHSEKSIPYSQIVGYRDGEREAIVYWWRIVPVPSGGFRADSIRATIVGL
jgi:hypothetical protein